MGAAHDVDIGSVGIRPATKADLTSIVALAASALGWRPGEPNAELLEWKHVLNPFGVSPMWVATDGDGRVVAFRAFLRWEFEDERGRIRPAARAVDTATAAELRGRGLFARLTRLGIEHLASEGAHGTELVFNTPNGQSHPGYLKMGWQDVGRVPVAVAPASPLGLLRLARSAVPAGRRGGRGPASKWSLPTEVGDDAGAVLADEPAWLTLLASQPPASGLRTRRSPAFLRWRYGTGPVRYRALVGTGRVEDGVVLFRLRQRAEVIELVVADVVVPGGVTRSTRRLVGQLLARVGADHAYAYALGLPRATLGARALRVPGQGPMLTWRPVDDRRVAPAPPAPAWDLRLGDIELF